MAAWSISMTHEGWDNVRRNVEHMATTDEGRDELATAIANDAFTRAHDMHGKGAWEFILPDFLPPGLKARMKPRPGHTDYKLTVRRGFTYDLDALTRISNRAKAKALELDCDTLANEVMDQIERHNTSDNGGYNVWADSEGYVTIPVDLLEGVESDEEECPA